MNEKELSLTFQWEIEDYNYTHNFSVERIGNYFSKISYKSELLPEPEFLYKFYDFSNWSLDSLLNQYLYFSNPRNFNDPFDCLSNREKQIKNMSAGVSRHRDEIGICCFSTVRDNPLMWGHYTKSFSGFCVKFRNQDLLHKDEIAIRTHVSYLKKYSPSNPNHRKATDNLKEFNHELVTESFKKNTHYLLAMLHEYCWKYYDWKYEKEYRAITINSSSFQQKLSFENSEVLEIYIGFRMKSLQPVAFNFLKHIITSKYPHAKIFEVSPHPLIVKLDFNEIQ